MSTPTGTAVWFGSPLAVGVKNVGPVLAETRAVGDQHVTVFAAKSALRRQILGTAEAVDVDANGCPTRAVQVPTAGSASSTPTSTVGLRLLPGHGFDRADVVRPPRRSHRPGVRRRAAPGGPRPAPRARSVPTGRWVALGLHGDGATRWDVVDLRCGAIERPGGTVPLTPATVRDWARDGVTAYAVAPAGLPRSVAAYFHTGAS